MVKICFKTFWYTIAFKSNEKWKKYFQKKSEIFVFFSFDLYTYIVLKHLNKIKIYRYIFFFIFRFSIFFPLCSLFVSPLCVVVPRVDGSKSSGQSFR